MIAASHNMLVVFASIAVSLVAAFTGPAITNNIATLLESKRKLLVVIVGIYPQQRHLVQALCRDIGAVTSQEIALSILTEIIALRRRSISNSN